MDKLTIDKTAAAILSSLLLLTAANTLVDMIYPTGRNASKSERPVDVPVKKETPGVKAAPEPSSAIALLSSANSAEGEKAARKCEVCHSFKQGGAVKVGPELYDIVGRKVASVPGFGYSPALKAKGGEWTYEELDAWLTNPAAAVPGSKMAFAGAPSAKERAALLAYLRTLSANPKPLPETKPSPEAVKSPPEPAPSAAPSSPVPPAGAPSGAGPTGSNEHEASPPPKNAQPNSEEEPEGTDGQETPLVQPI